jgi:hypothetical protein
MAAAAYLPLETHTAIERKSIVRVFFEEHFRGLVWIFSRESYVQQEDTAFIRATILKLTHTHTCIHMHRHT